MKGYTLGFIFNRTLDKVLLIHKSRPAHHAGKINGLGGKIEPNEEPLNCLIREIKEESGLSTVPEKWVVIGKMHSPNWQIDTFAYVYENDLTDAKTMEDQQIEWFDVKNLPENLISNLYWLIPLCLDKISWDPDLGLIDVEYTK